MGKELYAKFKSFKNTFTLPDKFSKKQRSIRNLNNCGERLVCSGVFTFVSAGVSANNDIELGLSNYEADVRLGLHTFMHHRQLVAPYFPPLMTWRSNGARSFFSGHMLAFSILLTAFAKDTEPQSPMSLDVRFSFVTA
ncbi:uncharacterized protein FOMMEDRAFT_151024 [Fomitiporia mediterranea MF3/22]|uniref:uncharacterized protein n=1 Tax=Fomitiporia mediterranea (strain MF3/22) TaxID=694068 RepID=UPI0004407C1C|nr:uncharacterized protein FOMMEDRAFT_151024 [Fomitiporia mediterranea MF3/22]EJD08275.1 hypothetical protein FOMMEDRAFT_151024 [Fomitiporia mediterranea MF3/22]